MSSDAQVVMAIAVVGYIFSAGAFIAWAKAKIAELINGLAEARQEMERDLKTAKSDLYRDINGIGNRVRQNEDAAARRYHNQTAVFVFMSPKDKETAVMGMLREDR